MIRWRQGRSLAYGDGAAFWALAEIVKAQAGILEQDSEAVAGDRLAGDDRRRDRRSGQARWVESHLRPLVGLGADEGFGGDRRGEAFAAWRRALEALAESGRWSSSSRTCTGPTTACSTSSTSWSAG